MRGGFDYSILVFHKTRKMITIFSKDYCPYCSAAKGFIESIGREYEEIDMTHHREKMLELVQISGMMTVPQIFDGEIKKENLIGGYDDMLRKYEAGEIFQDTIIS
jgi:glutaredoxin 3